MESNSSNIRFYLFAFVFVVAINSKFSYCQILLCNYSFEIVQLFQSKYSFRLSLYVFLLSRKVYAWRQLLLIHTFNSRWFVWLVGWFLFSFDEILFSCVCRLQWWISCTMYVCTYYRWGRRFLEYYFIGELVFSVKNAICFLFSIHNSFKCFAQYMCRYGLLTTNCLKIKI